MLKSQTTFRLRSYVSRNSRETPAQAHARAVLSSEFVLNLDAGLIQYQKVFAREAPCFLEIGFGMGQSLLAAAALYPQYNFIGIEPHRPGVGALLLGIQAQKLTNLRIYIADAIDVLEQCLPDASLAGINIFFPDPWPKRRHHPRRLIQTAFLQSIIKKLAPHARLDLATDWEDYAKQMQAVLSKENQLLLIAAAPNAPRSPYRPILTKFEKRALEENRLIWELQFARKE
jgi:tRNA (guanine-N7-)-methyltransferase